ncbi:helix-turn-helix domain-containing protein [Paracoccus sp. R12_1]|uniref:helix-turn-helix domain-containing protein n=1 Tax=unclassified Paracoccus (in: a-proteobacteria) TaxID=2688777 RepID=UPI001AD9C4F1|nr:MULTISPECIES: helix-turn-helix domain-containing protein [unclassified Paracoccus (in: a-proteobacteria)]MBO9455710.1 helix-turn-helix domain-containing protein [Paracoccus sp. R12_2]MBO9487143.1 helix-turn-helix domain-containing protein [Paracoccus sp. R12_1]
MKLLDISEVVEASGAPASTLRYYETLRLIAPVGRHGLRRQYEPDVLQRLALINMGQSAGLSLGEISDMFGPNATPEIPREDLHQRANALDSEARRMIALATMMRHVADCPAPSHMECPTFLRLLRIGVAHRSRACKRPVPGLAGQVHT